MMDNRKNCNVQNPEEIKELKDEQMEAVTGGLGVPTIGPVNLSGIQTGQALPEDTGFGKSSSTPSPASRCPKR